MTNEAARPTERQVSMHSSIDKCVRAHAVMYLEKRSFLIELREGQSSVVGRSEEADVQLPTPTISRRHFVLRWGGGHLTVQDCGSTNGTFVNGERLQGEMVLRGGDQISAGDALVVVGISSPHPLMYQVRPAEAFEAQLAQALLKASRLGRLVALVRFHFRGSSEQIVQSLATVLSALPGQASARALKPTDYHVLVEESAETVRSVCQTVATGPLGQLISYGVALFPRDGQDVSSLLAHADAALGSGTVASPQTRPNGPIAVDPASARVFSLVERVATNEGTVLVIGETGVGKEVVAQEIHRRSARSKGPFVPVNCGAIPSSMLARELFGHERGAFTGSDGQRPGFFEAASGGTLFLDEVGEIPLADQASLLRAIETRTITRLGGTRPLAVDIRIIAATNRELSDLVQQGQFRQDLLYRLDVLAIMIPALRDRKLDIEPLALHFLSDVSGAAGQPTVSLSPGALKILKQHSWPGNVRELRNVIERLALLASGPVITEMETIDVLYGRSIPGVNLYQEIELKPLLESVERAAIERALRACGGNQTLAAERLGISRRTLIYRMQSHGIAGPRKNQ